MPYQEALGGQKEKGKQVELSDEKKNKAFCTKKIFVYTVPITVDVVTRKLHANKNPQNNAYD